MSVKIAWARLLPFELFDEDFIFADCTVSQFAAIGCASSAAGNCSVWDETLEHVGVEHHDGADDGG